MPELDALLSQSAALHNHLCPRQVLGVRMGMYAAVLLALPLPQADKHLFTFVETDGCFADGVMVATGCSLGHRTLRLMDYGKVAAVFVDTETDRAVRISTHPQSRLRAEAAMSTAPSRWEAQRDAYQILPFADLFVAREVSLNLSLKAIISKPGIRTICAVCGEEIVNEREISMGNEVLCQSCAGESYWSPAGQETILSSPVAHIGCQP